MGEGDVNIRRVLIEAETRKISCIGTAGSGHANVVERSADFPLLGLGENIRWQKKRKKLRKVHGL